MMGYSTLCLLLLLSSFALAQDVYDKNGQPTCQFASPFKAFKKYVYQYTADSRNGVVGTANLRNGPKVFCQVEIEVPQACRYIMRTRSCALTEVSAISPQGEPLFMQASSSESFQAAMEKYPLKFTIEDTTDVQLYPEEEEPVNILNIKRGIVSALMAPVIEEEQSSLMSTVHGQCSTDSVVNVRLDIATDVTLSRDLSQCDHFYSREVASSPLALLQKLHHPMSKLIESSQECNYHFDNRGKHITTAMCTEKHIYLPFSHEDNGISSVVTQELSFQSSKRTNNRVFDVNHSQKKTLYFEDPDDKAPIQTKDRVLSTLQDLVALADTDQGQERTGLFHKLVSGLRVLRNDTLSRAVTEMLDESVWLTWQALLQCGTPECTSAILQAIRTIDGVSLEVDALVYGLSLQANPDSARVRDMLSMAQYRQSRAIMYALANTVKKFHKGKVTPVVIDVSNFMEMLLNDCLRETSHIDSENPTHPEEMSFLVLKVVAVMGKAMQAANPGLISSILRCARRTDISLLNQKAAIQAFRLMDINDEVRNALMEVYRDDKSHVEKRLAAYLILMKNPEQALVRAILTTLENERDEQIKSFVLSHLNNILNSAEPQMDQFRDLIELALRDLLPSSNKASNGMSGNYKIATPFGSVQSNIIFDAANTLPKEVMLETTLKVFDYNYDIFEVGVEATGFEPTIDALFGDNGFFPDSISKVMYWADKKAEMLRGVLYKMAPDRDRMGRQVPQDLLEDIKNSARQLMDHIRFSPAPEAIAYLRLLGNEIGYMKTSEMRKMAETLFMYYHVFFRILPAQAFFALTSSTENKVFAHYIFMENAFSLPTGSGFPLKFSIAGVFSLGAKGGLTYSFANSDLSFMPSVGLEFITNMGVHIPDFVEAGLEMHTNAYHESSLNAKITMKKNQIRLSIPAPKSNTQLLSFSNKLLSISSSHTIIVPSLVEDRADLTNCQPLFSGLNLCTIVRYSNATSTAQAPYYPLTGETRFAIEIQPTGKVSEYTATITDETLREGRRGRNKVESLKLTLKTEGDEPTEATASLKYNRNRNTVVADIVIPDYDIEAGIKLSITDGDAKGKTMHGIVVDVTNRNIPQLTLVGHTRLDKMKDAMLQLQMVIPSLQTNASFTATLKRDEDVLMDVETALSLPKTSYRHKASLKYDDDRLELEMKSNLNSDIWNLIPNVEEHHRHLQQLLDHVLDQRVAMTDMKYRHIVSKGIVAGKKWLEKLTARMPYLAHLRSKRGLSDLTLPALPEKLFLHSDSTFRYQFNKDRMAISLPLPFGGKKSEELNIPTTLSFPHLAIPEIGIHIPAQKYHLPRFTVPLTLDFTIPLLGLAEASTKINSNLYSWEGSILGGNNTVDVPSYIGQFKVMAQSPFNLLSYKLEGTGMMSGRADDNLKYHLDSSFSHILLDTSVSVSETLQVTDRLHARANYRIEASSPLGLQASVYYSAQSSSTLNSDEVSGDGTVDGLLKIGSFYTNTSYTHNYNVRPLDREGRGESTLQLNSPFIQLHNEIQGLYANSELNIVSKTSALQDMLRHVAELKYKDAQLILKSNAVATAMGKSLNNKIELGVSSHMAVIRIESQADDDQNRLYLLLTGSLDSQGLEVNSEGSITLDRGCQGLHKASITVISNGLTTSGTNSIQCRPVAVENIFNGAIDSRGATLSSRTKGVAEESRGELNIEGKVTATEAFLDGVLKGHAYDATTRNNINILLNRRALTISSNIMGALKGMNTENSHTLTLTLWTLTLHSKTNNFFCEDFLYKQDTKINVKPFVMSIDMQNDLKVYDAIFNTENHMKVEPIKVDLAGIIKGAYGEKLDIKNAYELKYENLAGTMKHSLAGNVMNAQLGHNCELEFAGLSSKSNCQTQINSDPLRFDGTIHTLALPFSLTVDALVNSEGEINLGGDHAGQLYSKMLIRAEPLALAYSQESRLSTTHMLPNGESSTNVENKFEGLLTPSDQFLTWKVKSKLNDNAYDQDIQTYNNPEKIGIEFTGVMSTDLFSKLTRKRRSPPEIQDFSVAAGVKYDKTSDCHIIEIPFIESFPAAFDLLRNTLVQTLESIQNFVNSLDINQLISDIRTKLDKLPMQVREFMLEVDLENKINQVKTKLDYLINEFAVTMNDLEVAMQNFMDNLEITVLETANKIRNLILDIQDYVMAGHLNDKIEDVLSQIQNQLWAFDENYKIKETAIKALNRIGDIISQINLQKLTESHVAWMQDLDSKYLILDKMKRILFQMKEAIESFDTSMFFQDLKDYLHSVDFAMYVKHLSLKIPSSEISKVIESMNDVIVNWIDEYEIPNKLNAVYFYIKDLILKYHLDERFKDIMDHAVILVKEFKIEETVQSMTDALRTINFEFAYDKIMLFLHNITNHLKAIDFRKSIDYLNKRIVSMLRSMKEFDYSVFVDETNERIAALTGYVNKQIETYELVQKIEAAREFLREIQRSVFAYLDELKNTKVADALKKLKKVIDSTFYNDIKMKVKDILEDIRQRILDMDIRNEMYIHLQRASESYSNVIIYISVQLTRLMEKIGNVAKENQIMSNIRQAIDQVLDALKKAEIDMPTFTVPLTDLVIPAFTINLNKLAEISIPAQISVPKFTILNVYTIPAFTIDFEEIKAKIVSFIDDIKEYEIQTPDPEDIFGELKVLYLFKLPDVTFPEISLLEIKFPVVNIPTMDLKNAQIEILRVPDVKLPEVPSDICFPVFGKLQGEFRVSFPHYSLVTTGIIENVTSTLQHPQFAATITSYVKSSIEPLEYLFEATAHLEAPGLEKLQFTETVKTTHAAFSIEHEGSLTLAGNSAEALAKTTFRATTQIYTANLDNIVALSLKSGISAKMDTNYSHDLYTPSIETSSQASLKHSAEATVGSGSISVTSETNGNAKWSIRDYFDEGTHMSKTEFDINFNTAKLTFAGETDCKSLKSKQKLTVESVILGHFTVEGMCETEVLSVKKSIMVLNGEAHIGDLKVALTASHNAELTENLVGSVANSLEFIAHPFEISLDVKNKMNSKVFFPLKLTGKVDLQHDYNFILNSEKQSANWFALARFNHYKYNHNLAAENNEMDLFFYLSANGEANLDFLTVPLSIPAMTIPYLEIETPMVRELSLWEHAGFKSFLITPQQSFDMNLNLNYHKNPEAHSLELPLDPIYNIISLNANILRPQFEQFRDKLVEKLQSAYNQAKSHYINHKIDTSSQPPRIFTVPGYKIPILNIEVSAFSAEMPAFSYFVPREVSTPSFKVPALGFSVPAYTLVLPSLDLPVIYVPETLSEIQLPSFTLPATKNNIIIPAMGNISCDFSFKSAVITMSANAGLYNQSDIVARVSASSTSVFDVLNGKIDGTSSLTRKRGIKLATTVSMEHNNVEASHECAISLTKRSLEASVANIAKINSPFLNLELHQELNANTRAKPNVALKKKLKYMFYVPSIESVGKGSLDMNWGLEVLSSYISLETSTQGSSDITIRDSLGFVSDLDNEANFYLNANNLRATVRTALQANVDKDKKQKRSSNNNIILFDLIKSLALEVSLRRLFATVDYTSNNNFDLPFFSSNGRHDVKGELDVVPLKTFMMKLNINAIQPSNLGQAGLLESIALSCGSERQSFTWSGKEQLLSLIHAHDLLVSNDESEVRMDVTEAVEGPLTFLKEIRLPAYQKTLWDVLKFDQVTSMDNLQFLNISSSIAYTKSVDGQEYTVPMELSENGITFSIPGISIAVPSWIKDISNSMRNTYVQFKNLDVPDSLTLSPVFSVPAFNVPFTNLHVKTFTIDPQNLHIPKETTTTAFELKLPGLPKMSVPSYNVKTEYLQGKISFLSFKLPQHEIKVSSFPLPKSFSIGDHTISLDEITSQISNFEFPSIVIPEQTIEIPEISLYVPSSVFVPVFGALSATLRVSSPILNVSTNANLEKKDSTLVAALNSVSTSTMIFLEYDLMGRATLGFDDGVISLNGNCKFTHSDINVNCQHVLAQRLRTKRQTSETSLRESHHIFSADVTSQTFFDASFRFASRKDGITVSVLSPTSGFLGFHLQQRSMSQLYGKLFCRYPSTPDKDTDVLTAKATLKNSKMLMLHTSWNWDFLHDVIEGTKDRIPAMSNAVLKFMNKYHIDYFGFDLNRGAMKLKNTFSNFIQRAYQEVSMSLTNLYISVRNVNDQGQEIYRKTSDSLMSMTMQDITETLSLEYRKIVNYIEDQLHYFLHVIRHFLRNTKLAVPGREEKLSGLEMLHLAHRSASRASERVFQVFANFLGRISSYIRNVQFTLPGTHTVINGNDVMDKMMSSMNLAYDQLKLSERKGLDFLHKIVYHFGQVIAKKGENFLFYLQDENIVISSKVDTIHKGIMKSSQKYYKEANLILEEYKELSNFNIQQAYQALNMEQVNNNTRQVIDIFQSHLYGGLNEFVDLVRRTSQSTTPYVKVSNTKMDIEIPLPFLWRSFSEWPRLLRH